MAADGLRLRTIESCGPHHYLVWLSRASPHSSRIDTTSTFRKSSAGSGNTLVGFWWTQTSFALLLLGILLQYVCNLTSPISLQHLRHDNNILGNLFLKTSLSLRWHPKSLRKKIYPAQVRKGRKYIFRHIKHVNLQTSSQLPPPKFNLRSLIRCNRHLVLDIPRAFIFPTQTQHIALESEVPVPQ